MKFYFLFIAMFPLCVQAQYFSGEIVYDIKIFPKSDTVDLEEIMGTKHGSMAKYLITAKKYKSTYYENGEFRYSYTYDEETKRMIDDYNDKPYLTFRDSRKTSIKFSESQILRDRITTILGYDCYMVKSESSLGASITYYSDDIKVDYKDFEGHKVGNWYDRLKEVDGAITLKATTEYENYFEVREAIKVDKRSVNIKEFDLVEKPLAAAFSALDEPYDMKPPTQDQIQCYQNKVGAVSKINGEKYVVYIGFLLRKDGSIDFVNVLEEDQDDLFKVAVDIVQNCGFEFIPGKINKITEDAEVYFPVEFLR